MRVGVLNVDIFSAVPEGFDGKDRAQQLPKPAARSNNNDSHGYGTLICGPVVTSALI